MKRIIIVLSIFVFAAMLFAQMGPTTPWPYQLGHGGQYWVRLSASSLLQHGWIYRPSDYTWQHGTEVGKSYMTVTADIEMYMSMSLDATDIYFHIADDGQEFTALLDGELCSNNGQ